MEDDENIGTQNECDCCVREVVPPAITRLTCGTLLNKLFFLPSVRASIPDEAEQMFWLKIIYFENYTGSSFWTVDCDFEGTWATRRERSFEDGFYRLTYDPDEDCSISREAEGTGVETYQNRPDACDEPPDFTLTYDRVENHTLEVFDDVAGTTFTGTQDGSPISGSGIQVLPPTQDFLNQGNYYYPDPVGVLTIGTSPVSVLENWTQDGDFTDVYDEIRGHITEEFDHGYSDPDDYRLSFEFEDGANLYVQVRAMLYFTPAGGSEEEVEPVALDWKAGDPLSVQLAWPFPEIGTFRLGKVRMRHGKSGPFEEFEVAL